METDTDKYGIVILQKTATLSLLVWKTQFFALGEERVLPRRTDGKNQKSIFKCNVIDFTVLGGVSYLLYE